MKLLSIKLTSINAHCTTGMHPIQIPYDAADIADVLANLNAQPERLARIRTDNVVNSLLRHDWMYRWGTILDTVGLEHTPEMRAREVYLKNLAQMWADRKH
jgi:hypothetical protein